MSLTHPSGITESSVKKVIKAIIPSKSDFYTHDGSVCFDTKKKCVIDTSVQMTKDDSAVSGTAFDYLARFLIAKKVENNKEKAVKDLCAEHFIKSPQCLFQVKINTDSCAILNTIPDEIKHDAIFCGYNYSYISYYIRQYPEIETLVRDRIISLPYISEDSEARKELLSSYDVLINKILCFIMDENDEDDVLVESCIILAKLERMNRSGRGFFTTKEIFEFGKKDINIKNDLLKLSDSFKKIFLPIVNKNSNVIFNPAFGIGSRIVGGADSDVYIDGTLYDFKTSKKNGWSSNDATQIMGYYLIDLVAKRFEDQNASLGNNVVKRVALYKVRFEEINYFDCTSIDNYVIGDAINEICYNYVLYNISWLTHGTDLCKKLHIPFDNRKDIWNWSEMNLSYSAIDESEELQEIKNRLTNYLDKVDCVGLLGKLYFKNTKFFSPNLT